MTRASLAIAVFYKTTAAQLIGKPPHLPEDTDGVPPCTLLLAVGHQQAEVPGQAADGPGGQRLQGAQSLPVGLAEADHGHRGTRGAHVLAPLQASDPRQRTLNHRRKSRISKTGRKYSLLLIYILKIRESTLVPALCGPPTSPSSLPGIPLGNLWTPLHASQLTLPSRGGADWTVRTYLPL